MVGNRTIIPTGSRHFVKLSYPANLVFINKEHKFAITIAHPDGKITNFIAGYNLKNNRGWYKRDNGPRISAFDHKAKIYKNDTLFFSLNLSPYHAKPGTYTVSLKVKDYLPSCKKINITVKGLFIFSICKFQNIYVLTLSGRNAKIVS